jgi:hypothetical protein
MIKIEKNLQLKKDCFFDQKLQLLPRMDVQAKGEAFSPQKRTSRTSNHEISELFSTFVGHFCPPGPDPDSESGSRSRSTDLIESGSGSEYWFLHIYFLYIRKRC